MDDSKKTSFGTRLKFAMIRTGFASNRSPYGVNVTRLAEITRHSPQICRKYLNNTALPSIATIIDLSEALDVNPGWLLFGEELRRNKDLVSLSPALLRFVIEEGLVVQPHFKSNHDFTDFMMHVVESVVKFDFPEAQMRKIVRCMITSTNYLKQYG